MSTLKFEVTLKIVLMLLILSLSTLNGCSTSSSIGLKHSQVPWQMNMSSAIDITASSPEMLTNLQYSSVLALPFRQFDQRIDYGSEPSQFGLLWYAEGDAKKRAPIIALIHGGCWLKAYDVSHTYALATELSNQGFHVWNIEYRRSDQLNASWPQSYQDIRRALVAMDQLAVDFNRIVLLGHSAGGHLGLLAASDKSLVAQLPRLKAMVGLAAIIDIEQYAQGNNSCESATQYFIGAPWPNQLTSYREANPIHRSMQIPIYLFQGKQDPIVGFPDVLPWPVSLFVDDKAGHFDWVHPKSSGFRYLVQQLKDI
ncbi:alpha/beta hydrolase [Pleionea litopenaei]|uniref:Alpha/beta hydrolase n=1 Tax=Pleionea litopenaei TaxID=3070815 RepID=A0AA51RQI4_9GAMM|nr:alpha/beta hydrolase [Pleionea sp. HL-JVS1]WMS85679.1 alpha/beta hydrolase [Pleionea sp. HL-JVS1]